MKKIKNINLLLIILLLILLVYNCFTKKTIENVENSNSCPTKEEVKKLQEKNAELSKKIDTHHEKINEQNNTIQEAKMQKVKDFCDSAKQKFDDLNIKVNSIINNLKNNNN